MRWAEVYLPTNKVSHFNRKEGVWISSPPGPSRFSFCPRARQLYTILAFHILDYLTTYIHALYSCSFTLCA
ncbi:hypothetical protein Scep_020885 [Stephania cephalantha]|uniref:Uncharacterized protein n=1 Tax=Stephania cephalantha TaxID=152367 RepID=A0AAP0I0Z4_9MAGN